jgi:hypothetical protein
MANRPEDNVVLGVGYECEKLVDSRMREDSGNTTQRAPLLQQGLNPLQEISLYTQIQVNFLL